MNLIVEKKDKLTISSYKHIYVTKTLIHGLRLVITCKNDPQLFEELKSIVPLLKEDDVYVTILHPTKKVITKVKPEFVELDNENRARDAERKSKVKYHLKELEELGVDIKIRSKKKYRTPDSYLEVESEILDYSCVGLEVVCNSSTWFYKYMSDNKIITQSWYQPVF